MKNFSLLICGIVLAFSGCGELSKKFSRQNSGETQVSFGIAKSGLHSNGVLVRGMMIYMLNFDPNGMSMAYKFDDEDLVVGTTVSVPNGKYHILAVGWDGASPFTVGGSGIRCAKLTDGDAQTFTGIAKTLQLTMNNSTCDINNASGHSFRPPDAAFPYATALNLRKLRIKFCNGTGVSTANCLVPTSSLSSAYVQAELYAYKKIGPTMIESSGGLKTSCVAESTTGEFDIGPMIPGNASPGSPQLYAVRVGIYTTVGCLTPPTNVYEFPYGLAFASQNIPFLALDTASTHNAVLLNYGP